ncbi:MAG: hypothetical protein U9R26_09905 [Campylobacterota bacterium]|nr:hypothetical protein [Campylobacterota bacterium]
MKIEFNKVWQSPRPFYKEADGVVFDGVLQKSGSHSVNLSGEIKGNVSVQCNRCGTPFDYLLKTPIKLTISDQLTEDKDDLDIIEFLDGDIDISFILQSEINTLKSEYHYCEQCDQDSEVFEAEF